MRRFSIGQDAAVFIRRQLETGGVLSAEIMRVDKPILNVWAFLPHTTQLKAVQSFGEASLQGGQASREALANHIALYLAKRTDNCAVFEDPLSREGDPVLERNAVPYVTSGEEVLHYLCGSGHNAEDADRLLLTAKTYRLVGVLSRTTSLRPGRAIDRGLVSDLARAADEVIIGAWDGEAELIWSI